MMKHKPLRPIRHNLVNHVNINKFDKFDKGLDRTLKSASLISLIGSFISFVVGFFLLRGYLYKCGLVWLSVGDLGPSLFMMAFVALSVFILISLFPAIFGWLLVNLPSNHVVYFIRSHKKLFCSATAIVGLPLLYYFNRTTSYSIVFDILGDVIVASVASFIFISAIGAPVFSKVSLKGAVQARFESRKQIINGISHVPGFLFAVMGPVFIYLGFGLFTVLFSVLIFYSSSINESTKNHYSAFFSTGSIVVVIAMAWLGAFVASRPKSGPVMINILGPVIVVISSLIVMNFLPVSLAVVRLIGLGGLRYEITVKQNPSNSSNSSSTVKPTDYCIVAQDSRALYVEKIPSATNNTEKSKPSHISIIKKSDILKMSKSKNGICEPGIINP